MKRPWFALYPGDYLADTSRLSTEGHGAYLLLLMDYYSSGAPLPDDDVVLANITKLPITAWRRLRPVLASFFVIVDGKWRHIRVEKELREAETKYSKRAAAGKIGSEKRWGKGRKGNSNANSNANGKRIANSWQTNANHNIGNADAPYAEGHSLPESKETQGLERWQGDNQGANPANDTPSEGQPEWRVIGDEPDQSSATVIPLRRAVGDK